MDATSRLEKFQTNISKSFLILRFHKHIFFAKLIILYLESQGCVFHLHLNNVYPLIQPEFWLGVGRLNTNLSIGLQCMVESVWRFEKRSFYIG